MTNEEILTLAEKYDLCYRDRGGAAFVTKREDVDIRPELLAFARALLSPPLAPAFRNVLNRCERCRWKGKLCDGSCFGP